MRNMDDIKIIKAVLSNIAINAPIRYSKNAASKNFPFNLTSSLEDFMDFLENRMPVIMNITKKTN